MPFHSDGDRRFIAAADLLVHYREWLPASAPVTAPIVLVHGNWSTHRWWIPVAAHLPEHHLLAPDLRGRGDTRGSDHGYSVPELAADLLAFLDALALPRVHLVGHSLGTGVIMQLALEHPTRVASLVAIAPVWPDGMPERFARPDRQIAAQADRALYERMLRSMAPKAELGPLWDELVLTGHTQRPTATMRNLDALAAWRPGDRLRALTMPRVVIDGVLDPLCGGETAARAAQVLACERITLECGHSPNLEDPTRVGGVIARIVASSAQ
jgi:pimeloyl-ACP methyl ester carboxylesterase